jgi:hypothetical protein
MLVDRIDATFVSKTRISGSAEIRSKIPEASIITKLALFATQQAITWSLRAIKRAHPRSVLKLVLPRRTSQAPSPFVRQQSPSQRVGKQSFNNAVRNFEQCVLHVGKYMHAKGAFVLTSWKRVNI